MKSNGSITISKGKQVGHIPYKVKVAFTILILFGGVVFASIQSWRILKKTLRVINTGFKAKSFR